MHIISKIWLQELVGWWLNQPLWKKILDRQNGNNLPPTFTGLIFLTNIWVATTYTLGIESPCQMMIGVYNHLLRKVFRFHYHSQKVIGSLGIGDSVHCQTCPFTDRKLSFNGIVPLRSSGVPQRIRIQPTCGEKLTRWQIHTGGKQKILLGRLQYLWCSSYVSPTYLYIYILYIVLVEL